MPGRLANSTGRRRVLSPERHLIPPDSSVMDITADADELLLVLLALDALGLPAVAGPDDRYTVNIPEESRGLFDGADRLQLAGRHDPQVNRHDAEATCPDSSTAVAPLLTRLADEVRSTPRIVSAIPVDQPSSVHAFSGKLFTAYKVENGSVHLAGCTLEERPMLRVTYRVSDRNGGDSSQLVHHYLDAGGEPVDQTQRKLLGLDQIEPGRGRTTQLDDEQHSRLMATARVHADSLENGHALLLCAVIWCKHAEGKLRFTIGEVAAELPFSGWASALADGSQPPPPFVCPASGLKSYDLTATDDGRIVARNAITVCEATGRRGVAEDLTVCAATGKKVLADLCCVCPVSSVTLLKTELVTCPTCRQQVSPTSRKGDGCAGCRSTAAVNRDDHRMARVFGEHPGLERWRRWRIVETSQAYVLVATSFTQRLLVVVDKATLDPQHLATAGRFLSTWTEVSESQHDEILH